MNWINKLERKYRKYAIDNLMLYIIILQAVVYMLEAFVPESNIYSKFVLDPLLVRHGEIWRLITFIILPPESSPLWIIFTLYFYYLVGNSLDNMWGNFKFNLYYLIGVLATIAAAFITNSPVSNVYLNLSLFLAFAQLFPNYEVLVFFIIPIKVKYIALINWIVIIFTVAFRPVLYKVSAIASVVNYFIFFGPDIAKSIKLRYRTYQNRKRFKDAFK